MKKLTTPVVILASALIFTILFYKQSAGINLLMFELIIISIILFIQKDKLRNNYVRFAFGAVIISTVAFVINYSTLSFVINLLTVFVFTGVLIYPSAKSLVTSVELSLANLLLSYQKFFTDLGKIQTGKSGITFHSIAYRFKILLIPVLILGLFLIIYNISSPYFNNAFTEVLNTVNIYLNRVDFNLVLVFASGICCSIFPLIRVSEPLYVDKDKGASFLLVRTRKQISQSKSFGLKKEVISAKFLLITLNILILAVNVLDIYHVWFNFEWSGTYLKQFVHEGTYMLILSILISIGIVLYFFRGNVNFYTKSRVLKKLAIAWMVQNAILAVSVGIRNYWYIHHFALAYKRIGVIFFLLLTLYGIYTVIIKIKKRQSAFYLFKNNSLALFIVLLIISLFNWDSIIARYNFSHYKTSFIHYNFLSSLPGKTLPYLDKSQGELAEIDLYQQKLFRFEMKYMTSVEYLDKIREKKKLFKEKWESKGFLSWNFAEYRAYKKAMISEKM